MNQQTPPLEKYLIYVEHICPLSVWGNPCRDDNWRVYESIEPPTIRMRLNDCCGGGVHPYTSCDEEGTNCEERGIITKIELYNSQRAQELGLKVTATDPN